MAHHAAQRICLLVQGYFRSCLRKVIRTRHAGRSASDNSGFFAVLFCRIQRVQDIFITSHGCLQFIVSDMYRFLIKISRTFAHAVMGTDGSCVKRKRVSLHDDFQRLFVFSFVGQRHVCRNILMNRASLLTRRHITVQERNRLFHFPGRKRLCGFYMVLICPGLHGKL